MFGNTQHQWRKETDADLPERFPFSVHRSGEMAFVAMNCGGGVTRVRHMPLELLKTIGDLCRDIQDRSAEALEGREVPLYPGFLPLLRGEIHGACHALMGAHRREGIGVERLIAIYDEDDGHAPVLLLVEEQIEEFISKA